VRNCPHHSIQLDLRNPSLGFFSQSRRGLSEALFSVTLTGVVIAVKAAPVIIGGESSLHHQIWGVQEIIAALLIAFSFTGIAIFFSARPHRQQWRESFTICGHAYLPVAFTGLLIIYFRVLVEEGARVVPLTLSVIGLGSWLDLERLTPEMGTLRLLIYPLIIAGGLFSWIVMGRLKSQYNLHNLSYYGHRFMALLATAAFLYLL
jgi:hypothetical protein